MAPTSAPVALAPVGTTLGPSTPFRIPNAIVPVTKMDMRWEKHENAAQSDIGNMSLLQLKRNMKRAWSEGWPLDKVQGEVDILFLIAEAAERVCDNELRLENQVAIDSSLRAQRQAFQELRLALHRAARVQELTGCEV